MKEQKIPELSIILPCKNEEQALPFCLYQIKRVIQKYKLNAEIIVSDSSIDKSPDIARENRVILIKHNKPGYGIAYLEAFKHARGKYILMADSDRTYNFDEIPDFLNSLKEGYDLVIGNRLGGKMEKDAMPLTHKYIGIPVLSTMLKIFFGVKIRDSQSGMRAIKKESLKRLKLETEGMEFASEMLIKAIKNKLKIKEIPISYNKREGHSKLKPFYDAWKHIHLMIFYKRKNENSNSN